jgi:beta-glucosidase
LAAIILAAGATLAPVAQAVSTAAAVGPCGDPAQRPWCDTSLGPDQRAALLLNAMTVSERIELLGGDIVTGGPVGQSHTGASFAVPRLGIPAVYYTDGPVGPRQGSATAMPVPIALAATFDPTAANQYGAEVGAEARAKGNDVVFGPTVNMMRVPQGGRSYEAYGEDPYLVERTTVGWIEGAQSQGVIADVKHFAGNNQEGLGGLAPVSSFVGGRQFSNDVIDERTLREVYLPQFEAAVKEAGVGTVMCAYNQVAGQYSCENQHLLTQVLRQEWGFKGYVLADYGAAHNTAASITNGLDFDPWPAVAYSPNAIQAALTAGLITEAQVDAHVLALLRTQLAFGVFDRPKYPNDDSLIDKPAHATLAQRIEESAITLLQNRGSLLPLSASLHRVAVVGPYGDRFITGGGSGQITPFAVTTALQGIKSRVGPAVNVTFDDGSNTTQAAADAAAADVAVVVVGDVDTEGQDKSCIDMNCPNDAENALPFACSASCPPNGTNEDGLVSAVAAANPRTVVVMETSGPVLTPWRDQVPAIVEAWYPGEQGGTAIARVLFGDVDPGGRLPATFPVSSSDPPTAGDPARYPGLGETVNYSEGVFIGYRWYDANQIQPAFAFGGGLSYTTFDYSGLQVTGGGAGGAVATVSAQVTNTGNRAGTAVPELYLHLPPPSTSVPQPPRQLRGYSKLSLAPGQSAQVSFPLFDRGFSYWDVGSNSWKVAPGCYEVMVGASSRSLPLMAVISRGGADCGTGSVVIPEAPSAILLPILGIAAVVLVLMWRGRRARVSV